MFTHIKRLFLYHSWYSRAGVLLFFVGFFLMGIAYAKGIQILLFIPALALMIFFYALWDYARIVRNVRHSLGEEHGKYYLKLFFPKNRFLQFNLLARDAGGKTWFVKLDQDLTYQFQRDQDYQLSLLVFGRFNILRRVIPIGKVSFSSQIAPFEYFLVEPYTPLDSLRSVDPLKTSLSETPFVRRNMVQSFDALKQGIVSILSPSILMTQTRFRLERLHGILILIACIGIVIEWEEIVFDLLLAGSIVGVALGKRMKVSLAERWKNLLMGIAFVCMIILTFVHGDMSGPGSVFLTQILIFLYLFPKSFHNSFLYIFLSLFVLVSISLFSNQVRYLLLFSVYLVVAIGLLFSISGNESFDDEVYTFSTFHSYRSQMWSVVGVFVGIILLYFLIPHGDKGDDSQAFGSSNSDAVVSGFSEKIELSHVKKISQDERKVIIVEQILPSEIGTLSLQYFTGLRFEQFLQDRWERIGGSVSREIPQSANAQGPSKDLEMRYFLNGGKNIFLPSSPIEYRGEVRVKPMNHEKYGDVAELLYRVDDPVGLGFAFRVDSQGKLLPQQIHHTVQKSTKENTEVFSKFIDSLPQGAKKSPQSLALYIKNQAGFSYSLDDIAVDVEDFLYHKKKGHCEYFATTLAVTLQRLGYDALLVNGYAYGEYNDLAESLVLRANNAHAWVEVWDEQTQVRKVLDPTPGVTGYEDVLNILKNQIVKRYDYVDIKWYTVVASYTQTEQLKLYIALFDFVKNNWLKLLFSGLGLVFLVWFFRRFHSIRQLTFREVVAFFLCVFRKKNTLGIDFETSAQEGLTELFYSPTKRSPLLFLKKLYKVIFYKKDT